MQCLKPLTGYRSKDVNPSGKRSIVFNPVKGLSQVPFKIPCGQCRVCRLNKSRETAVCAVHEASLYEANSFITLTYSPANMPEHGSLVKKDFQDFIKLLRSKYAPRRIRYLQCGEYGEKLGRPHYHACLFNYDFQDKKYWKTHNENKYFVSEELDSLWKKGHCLIGDVTFESAAYVGRYITKKKNGPRYASHYGEKIQEYATMSQSLGKGWFEKYRGEIYPSDTLVLDGRVMLPPKRYDRLLEKVDPALYEEVKRCRLDQTRAVKKAYDNLNPRRLEVKERLLVRRMNQLERCFENEVEGVHSL